MCHAVWHIMPAFSRGCDCSINQYGIGLWNTPVLSLLLLLFRAKLRLFCNPMDSGPPSSSVHGVFQASILGCHSLLQGNLPDPGIKPPSPALHVGSLPLSHQGSKSGSRCAHPETSPMCTEWECEQIITVRNKDNGINIAIDIQELFTFNWLVIFKDISALLFQGWLVTSLSLWKIFFFMFLKESKLWKGLRYTLKLRTVQIENSHHFLFSIISITCDY